MSHRYSTTATVGGTTIAALVLAAACGSHLGGVEAVSPIAPGSREIPFVSSEHWHFESSNQGTAVIRDDGASSSVVVAPGKGGEETLFVDTLDVSSFKGGRVRATVRGSATGGATAHLRLQVLRAGDAFEPWNICVSEPLRADPTDVSCAVDVPRDARGLRLRLETRDAGSATFSPPSLTSSQTPPAETRALTTSEVGRLRALASLVGYLRFFHPSDQSAELDWHGVEVEAVRRVLAAKTDGDVREAFVWLTAVAAPTAKVYTGSSPPSIDLAPSSNAWLTRWQRVGFGADFPFLAVREGLSEPADLGAGLYKYVSGASIKSCKHAVVRSQLTVVDGAPNVTLYVSPTRGFERPGFASAAIGASGEVKTDVATSVSAIGFGVRVSGFGQVVLEKVALECEGKVIATMTPSDKIPVQGRGSHLFKVDAATCDGDTCIRVTRERDVAFNEANDVLDQDLGNGVRLRMPLVVWTDGKNTMPSTEVPRFDEPWAMDDLSARVAAAVDVWVTLRWFYPYFDDLGVHWDDQFAPAVNAASNAASQHALQEALEQLVAALHDDHAHVGGVDYVDGVLPIFLRKRNDRLFVAGAVDAYKNAVALGSEVVSVDGVPTKDALTRLTGLVSAATDGWRDDELTYAVGYGHKGEFVTLGVAEPGGQKHEVRVPRVDITENIEKLRETHAANGTELAPGVFYIDLNSLDLDAWVALLPKLTGAHAVIFDLRGYMTNAAFDVLGHFSDAELWSPLFDSPIVAAAGGPSFERGRWRIFPRTPRLSARAIFLVDGRAASAPETLLQIVHAHKLGLIVGEQTGGTNGNVAFFTTVGGLRVRFTGMRVLNEDGSQLQGKGITPDVVVHPTADDFVLGRDPILDAAIKAAMAP